MLMKLVFLNLTVKSKNKFFISEKHCIFMAGKMAARRKLK